MKISELIENWKPGVWSDLKAILLALAEDKDVTLKIIKPDED
ncbi:hypothetical protein ES703_88339 [subsurface metagenome]